LFPIDLYIYFSRNATRRPPDKPPRPLAAKPSRQKKLRALYDFQARSADELSFQTDDELLLIDNSGMNLFISKNEFLFFSLDETWWKAELNGKTGKEFFFFPKISNNFFVFSGVVPANYVELMI